MEYGYDARKYLYRIWKSSIYPFDPQAIKTDEEENTNFSEGDTTNDVNIQRMQKRLFNYIGDINNNDEGSPTSNSDKVNFTLDKMQLYQK